MAEASTSAAGKNPRSDGEVSSGKKFEHVNHSVKSRMAYSTRSSASSKSSRSTRSNISLRKLDAASDAAALEAKLFHLEKEMKAKVELERIQLNKELDMAKARLQAITELQDAEYQSSRASLPESDGEQEYVKEYVSSLPCTDLHVTSAPASECNEPVPHFFPTPVNEPICTSTVISTNPVVSGDASVPVTSPASHRVNFSDELVGGNQVAKSPVKDCRPKASHLNPESTTFMPTCQYTRAQSGHEKGTSLRPVHHSQPNVVNQVPYTIGNQMGNMYGQNSQPNVVNQVPYTIGNQMGNMYGQNLHETRSPKIPSQMQDFASSFAEQLRITRLPTPEPGVFCGDPLSFPTWKAAFETLVEHRGIDAAERLYYLKKYLGGEAREAVEGYFLFTTQDSYDEAKKLLESRYGDPFVVANAFRSKIDTWPKIPSKDGIQLRKYADFLKQCSSAMLCNDSLQVLNDPHENRKLTAKLPDWLINRWGRNVAKRKENDGRFPQFNEFAKFVETEAKIACDPVLKDLGYSRNKVQLNAKPSSKPTSSKTFSTKTSQVKAKEPCPSCSKNDHILDNCEQFKRRPIQERKEYIKKSGRCFGCFRVGHHSKDCKNRLVCRICKKRHPTSLHGDKQESDGARAVKKKDAVVQSTSATTGVSHLNDTSNNNKASMIVPVWISHQQRPDQEILTYALLDTQSDTTFMLEEICDDLGIAGQNVRLSLSTMSAKDQLINCTRVDGLRVRAFDSSSTLSLPATYTRSVIPANRAHIPTPNMARKWSHLQKIADKIHPLMDCNVGLLIGYNCSSALAPRDVIPPETPDQPYGQQTDLGWGIVGVVDPNEVDCETDIIGVSHRIVTQLVPKELCSKGSRNQVQFAVNSPIKEEITPFQVARMMELDFSEQKSSGRTLSQEDKRFLQMMEEGIKITGKQHYEMPLPFKLPPTSLPNNRHQVMKRLEHLKRKLKGNTKFARDYKAFMQNLIDRGFAERIPEPSCNEEGEGLWYIPHHGVYHPKKPDKIRVVFDCSARYQGQALNDYLLQGPDLTNGLIGVMCRFRKENIAFMCDIEQMFYQFEVKPEHRNYLRFLWWENGDHETSPVEYQMNVHLFGAVSSPGCANFGLKRIADDNEAAYGYKAADFIREDFYVDDGLKSVPTVQEAIDLISSTKEICSRGGLRLHKFVSNSDDVMAALPPEDRANGVKDLDLLQDSLPIQRALGIQWCIESDTFVFRITLHDQPLTRRGVLSTVSSIYDPLGFLAPLLLKGKQILQRMCKEGTDWDSPLPDNLRSPWEQWRNNLLGLENLKIPRCYKPKDFGQVEIAEIHHFSDASSDGYGTCSYLRLVDDQQRVHCTLLMGKSRVAPLKTVTIPRLELTGAVVSVKVSALLKRELKLEYEVSETFWTDSKIVLAYIANESRRFHVFVANRVQQIRDQTDIAQWRYVKSNQNPADEASRGITANELENSKWLTGPDFLWMKDIPTDTLNGSEPNILNDDPEVKRTHTLATHVDENPLCPMSQRLAYFSSWSRATRAVANTLNIKTLLKNRALAKQRSGKSDTDLRLKPVNVEDICRAEKEIIKIIQHEEFEEEFKVLSPEHMNQHTTTEDKTRKTVKASSPVYRLDPFVDAEGIMRVGGRIQRADLPPNIINPVILPRRHYITELIVRHFHELAEHQGRGITTNQLRSNGFWIIGCSSVVSSIIAKCITCRRFRCKLQDQKMADLPEDRLNPAPPFTFCAVDFFGPWLIKEGRKEMKRYGVLFTCMASRAIHIETANSLTADSFINVLRRFVAIRGPMQQLRSDRGTNFVGAEAELKEALKEMNHDQVRQFLLKQRCDYFDFNMNVPSASHMGGVWERQIRTIRSVLTTLLHKEGTQLNDESLRTLLCEVTAIVNSRPLTVDNLNDPMSLAPLTPNHILTLKSRVVLPPPGEFQRQDMYLRKTWRRVQRLANEFWSRWQKEYLQNLQSRAKWVETRRDIQVGDIVIVKEDGLPRNKWSLAKVEETHVDQDGHVRKVTIVKGDDTLDEKGKRVHSQTHLERPIHKLVLLLESSDETSNLEN